MAQTHKTRLDRLEIRAGVGGGVGRLIVVMEDPHGNLTTLDGDPWTRDQAGALDTVVRLVSYAGGAA